MKVTCSPCEQKFINQANLIRHNEVKHNTPPPVVNDENDGCESEDDQNEAKSTSDEPTKEKKVECENCGKFFEKKKDLVNHRNSKH